MNRSIPPHIYSATDFEFILPPCSAYLLENNIPCYTVNTGVQEVISLELVFNAGTWQEPQKGVAQAVAALLKSGTKKKTAHEISQQLDQYGIKLTANASADWFSISMNCMTKHFKHAIPLLMEIITDTTFPEKEIEIYQQNTIQKLSIQLTKSDFVANRIIDAAIFGDTHPYGKCMYKEDYLALKQNTLQGYLTQQISSKNCTLFLAGKYTPHEEELINLILGKSAWNNQEMILTKQHKIQLGKDKKIYQTLDEKSVQGAIRIASPFVNKHHPHFYPCIVLNTIFGGYFGSRLMKNIREDKGYTYGIYSYIYNTKNDTALAISTEAGKDVCQNTIHEIYKEMELLRNEPIPEEELQLVKNYLLGTILGDLDGAFQIMQRWKNLILNSFTEETFYRNIEIYKTITSTQIQELANTYLHNEYFYEVLVT